MIRVGLGRHIAQVSHHDVEIFDKAHQAFHYFYPSSIAFARASALFFLSRVFPKEASSRLMNGIIITTHALNVGWFLGFIIQAVSSCTPINRFWETGAKGTCHHVKLSFLILALIGISLDLMILLLPVSIIRRMSLTKLQKAGTITILGLGYAYVTPVGLWLWRLSRKDINMAIELSQSPSAAWWYTTT